MEEYKFKTKGTCSTAIVVGIEDGIIQHVRFTGGCPGNLAGISTLVKGRGVKEVAELLRGIRCGSKPTSCPDQLAQALLAIAEGRG